MRTKVLLSLLKKEFLNIIRDKKTFITMILLPLLAFPLMVGLLALVLTSYTEVSTNEIVFGVNYKVDEEFQEFLDNYSEDYTFKIKYDTNKNLKKEFDDGTLGIYILKEDNTYNMHFDENNTNTLAETSLVYELYYDYQEEYIKNKLNNLEIDYEAIKDEFQLVSVQESVTEMGTFIPAILSMMLTLLIASTAFSVAIEITTSEKEKGTLETLLSLPIKKSELITSKYLTTAIMSTISGVLTYISLFATLFFAKDTLSVMGLTSLEINSKILIIYFIAIVLFSVFLSGIILSMAIFCKSLKEAQNTLTPIEIGIALISYLPMLGVQASIKNSIIPFANIALLFNNALSSNIEPLFVILTFLSTICYSMILIIVVSKIYNEEDALFHTANLKYMSFSSGKEKTVAFNIFTSVLLLIIIYLLGLYASLLFATTSKYVIISILPLTALIVILISSILVKLDFKKAFKFQKFDFKQFMYLLLLLVGTRVLSEYIITIIANLFPKLVDDFGVVANTLTVDNIYLGLLTIAILPAIAEELLFRGIVYNSFTKKYGPIIGIIISALLFGIYHMNWLQGINAFFLGLVFGYAYYKTKSIFAPMIMHFLNNAYGVILMIFPSLNIEYPMYAKIMIALFAIILIITSIFINEKELRK